MVNTSCKFNHGWPPIWQIPNKSIRPLKLQHSNQFRSKHQTAFDRLMSPTPRPTEWIVSGAAERPDVRTSVSRAGVRLYGSWIYCSAPSHCVFFPTVIIKNQTELALSFCSRFFSSSHLASNLHNKKTKKQLSYICAN